MSRSQRAEIKKRKHTRNAANGVISKPMNVNLNGDDLPEDAAIIAQLLQTSREENFSNAIAKTKGISLLGIPKESMVAIFDTIIPGYFSNETEDGREAVKLIKEWASTIKQSNTVIIRLDK